MNSSTFTIAGLTLPFDLIFVLLAYISFRIAQRFLERDREVRKFWDARMTLAVILGLLFWKITPVFTRYNDVFDNPMLILYMNGGLPALLGGLAMAGGFLAISLVQIRKSKEVSLRPSLFSTAVGLAVFLVLHFAIVFVVPVSGTISAEKNTQIGQAYSTLLSDLDGKMHALADFKGKVLVVNFWATWCPPCLAELPEFREASSRKLAKTTLVGVDLLYSEKEGVSGLKQFIDKQKISWLQLTDADGSFASTFEVASVPTTLVFDPLGKLVERRVGAVDLSWLLSLEKKYAN